MIYVLAFYSIEMDDAGFRIRRVTELKFRVLILCENVAYQICAEVIFSVLSILTALGMLVSDSLVS